MDQHPMWVEAAVYTIGAEAHAEKMQNKGNRYI